jgi:hypothetical protein
MLRSLKNRLAKMEETLGRKRGAPIIIVQRGETTEQAQERDFREHPEDRDCEFYIFIHRAAPPPAGGLPGPPVREVEERKPLPPPRKPLQITE